VSAALSSQRRAAPMESDAAPIRSDAGRAHLRDRRFGPRDLRTLFLSYQSNFANSDNMRYWGRWCGISKKLWGLHCL
jgi:hypothetical protein